MGSLRESDEGNTFPETQLIINDINRWVIRKSTSGWYGFPSGADESGYKKTHHIESKEYWEPRDKLNPYQIYYIRTDRHLVEPDFPLCPQIHWRGYLNER